MEAWVLGLLASNPQIGAALAAMGLARLAFKPLCSAIQAIVDKTETKDDDLWWSDVQHSKWFKWAAYILDVAASIKLPKGQASLEVVK